MNGAAGAGAEAAAAVQEAAADPRGRRYVPAGARPHPQPGARLAHPARPRPGRRSRRRQRYAHPLLPSLGLLAVGRDPSPDRRRLGSRPTRRRPPPPPFLIRPKNSRETNKNKGKRDRNGWGVATPAKSAPFGSRPTNGEHPHRTNTDERCTELPTKPAPPACGSRTRGGHDPPTGNPLDRRGNDRVPSATESRLAFPRPPKAADGSLIYERIVLPLRDAAAVAAAGAPLSTPPPPGSQPPPPLPPSALVLTSSVTVDKLKRRPDDHSPADGRVTESNFGEKMQKKTSISYREKQLLKTCSSWVDDQRVQRYFYESLIIRPIVSFRFLGISLVVSEAAQNDVTLHQQELRNRDPYKHHEVFVTQKKTIMTS